MCPCHPGANAIKSAVIPSPMRMSIGDRGILGGTVCRRQMGWAVQGALRSAHHFGGKCIPTNAKHSGIFREEIPTRMILPFLSLRRREAKSNLAIIRKHCCTESFLPSRGEEYPPYEPPSFSWACRAHTRPGLSESPRTPLTAKACGPGPVFAFVLRSAAGQPRKLRACFSCLAPVGDAQAKSFSRGPRE